MEPRYVPVSQTIEMFDQFEAQNVCAYQSRLKVRYKTTFPSATRRPPHPALRATLSPKMDPRWRGQETRIDFPLAPLGERGWGRGGSSSWVERLFHDDAYK